MDADRDAARIRDLAIELGFDRVGIARATAIPRADSMREWLAQGRAGRMEYLHRHIDERTDPRAWLPGARSVIVVAHHYGQPMPPRPDDGRPHGRVARYAWGDDYHQIVGAKLSAMVERMRQTLEAPLEAKICVDTGPLLERELAAMAGIGWIGKNTMLLHPELGSYFFLGEIVTTLELAPDEPRPDRCGTCTRCLEACPTGALDAPYRMDATRCISYLTIELRGEVPDELRSRMEDWVFGCDVCQEVCPYNRHPPLARETGYATRLPGPHPVLAELLAWRQDDYIAALHGSAMRRATLAMLQRNARIAAENIARGAVPPIRPEP